MVTTAIELANKIRLNPRASLLCGHLEAQLKLSGGLSGFTPHHASQGCPIIQFDEKGNPPRTMGAGGVEIEAKIRESDPILQSIAGRLNAGHTFLQLMFGSKFTPPSESECRFLKEAGRMWANITQGRRNVFVAAIGVLTPNGGYSTGRFYPLAIFEDEGNPLWLNPEALQGWMSGVDFPVAQQVRKIKAENVAAMNSGMGASWYESLITVFEDDYKGAELHEKILAVRAKVMVREGVASTLDEARQIAQKEILTLEKLKR